MLSGIDPLRICVAYEVDGRVVEDFPADPDVLGRCEPIYQDVPGFMESLTDGRSISLPALTTATAKLASRATGAYARIRYQFKSPVGAFEGVREALAQIAGNTYAMDAARLVTLAHWMRVTSHLSFRPS